MAGDGDGSDDDDGDGGGGEGSSETGTLASTVAMGSGGSSITAYTNDLEYLDDMFQLIATKIKFHQLDSQVRARARVCVCVRVCARGGILYQQQTSQHLSCFHPSQPPICI